MSLVEDSSAWRRWRSSSSCSFGQRLDHLLELVGVDQVAVVAKGDGAAVAGTERRLGVLPGARAGGGVAAVADRDVADEARERRLVEDLRDQAHVLVDQDLPAVAHRDAGRLLAAVLEGVQPEVGELGDVLARRPDPEHAAGVLGALVLRVECQRQPSVAAPASDRSPRLVGCGTLVSLGAGRPRTAFATARGPRALRCAAVRAA